MQIRKHSSNTSWNKAFTLVEMLVVIGIIALLAAFLFPMFATARERSHATSCANSLHQLHIAASLYAQDYDSYLPPYLSRSACAPSGSPTPCAGANHALIDSLASYTRSKELWRCPSDRTTIHTNEVDGYGFKVPNFTSYQYYGATMTSRGVVPLRLDHTVAHLTSTTFPFMQDSSSCPEEHSNYDEYNHRGRWNRIYLDGHTKTFGMNCTDLRFPQEF